MNIQLSLEIDGRSKAKSHRRLAKSQPLLLFSIGMTLALHVYQAFFLFQIFLKYSQKHSSVEASAVNVMDTAKLSGLLAYILFLFFQQRLTQSSTDHRAVKE